MKTVKQDVLDVVQFEQLLSTRFNLGYQTNEPCLRDIIYYYYTQAGSGIAAHKADSLTKQYIEKVWEKINA